MREQWRGFANAANPERRGELFRHDDVQLSRGVLFVFLSHDRHRHSIRSGGERRFTCGGSTVLRRKLTARPLHNRQHRVVPIPDADVLLILRRIQLCSQWWVFRASAPPVAGDNVCHVRQLHNHNHSVAIVGDLTSAKATVGNLGVACQPKLSW